MYLAPLYPKPPFVYGESSNMGGPGGIEGMGAFEPECLLSLHGSSPDAHTGGGSGIVKSYFGGILVPSGGSLYVFWAGFVGSLSMG